MGQVAETNGPVSSLKSPGRSEWHVRHRKERIEGDFRVTNYLGTAWIRLTPEGAALRFEVLSRKLDFEDEYRWMVQALADECQQLLLEWNSPTAFSIRADADHDRRLLLEQFLFLRHCLLGSDKLDSFLEQIRRRPHTLLKREQMWQPSAMAYSPAFVRDPIRFGRAWRENGEGAFLPEEVLSERKFETLDTQPNRFIKFALQQFQELCDNVRSMLKKEQGTAWMEAGLMQESLDAFLLDPFFDEVEPLHRIPLDNVTLQKREGYRDILFTWLMLEVAAQLDWPGRDDVYDGTNRDAATLYEYWLYFVLRKQLIEKSGDHSLAMVELPSKRETDSDILPFICQSAAGNLEINLREGRASLSRFLWTADDGRTLCVHLFFNRTFASQRDPKKHGSYSHSFRPDYTLVILPGEYADVGWAVAEHKAEQDGRIAYLHFDAKYRIEKLDDLFGLDSPEFLRDENVEVKTRQTYKRGDLYKMHTYNDAIRRTAGAYVFYPGNAQDSDEAAKRFGRFEELVPGVGAFAVRPGKTGPTGVVAVRSFIKDVLKHHLNSFTRDYRIRYWTHRTICETPPMQTDNDHGEHRQVPAGDIAVVVAWARSEAVAELWREKKFFYVHALKATQRQHNVPKGLLSADKVLPHCGGNWLSWTAKIERWELVERRQLIDVWLGGDESLLGSDTSHYYVASLKQPESIEGLPIVRTPRRGYEVVPWARLFVAGETR